MESIQEILSAIEFNTGLDLVKLGQHIKAAGGLSIFGTDIWFPDGTASRPLSVDANRKLVFSGASGTPVTTAGGTINILPKFTAATVLGDSRITDNGTNVTINNNGLTAKLILSNQTGSQTQSIAFDYSGTASDVEIKSDSSIGTNGALDFLFNGYSSLQVRGGQGTGDLILMGDPANMSGVSGAVKIRPSAGGYDSVLILQQEAIGTKPFLKCLNAGGGTVLAQIDGSGNATFASMILTADLPVSQGGTGASTFTANALIQGNTTSPLTSLALGTANRVLGMNSGATAHEYKDILGTTNQITATHAANSITLATPQDIHTGATPTFAGATINGNETVTGWFRTGDSTATPSAGGIACKITGSDYGIYYFDTLTYSVGGGSGLGDLRMQVNGVNRFFVTDNSNILCGSLVALATNATNGFLYIPTCAGTPTGTPTAYVGKSAMVYDTTNFVLYIYAGGAWRAH